MTNLIGISGRIGSGKDTVGEIICNLTAIRHKTKKVRVDPSKEPGKRMVPIYRTEMTWTIKKFASKLKQAASLITDTSLVDWESQEFKKQTMGAEWKGFYIWAPRLHSYVSGPYLTWEKAHEELMRNFYKGVEDSCEVREHTLTYREFLQKFGTEVGRNLHPNVWMNALFADYIPPVYWMCDRCSNEKLTHLIQIPSRYKERGYMEDEFVCPVCKGQEDEGDITQVLTDEYSKWIITDLRFPNEAEAIKQRGGILIRLTRNSQDYSHVKDPIQRKILESTKDFGIVVDHPSETALDNYPFDYVIDNTGTIGELVHKVSEILNKEGIV